MRPAPTIRYTLNLEAATHWKDRMIRITLLTALVLAPVTFACEYNVRDVGFVELTTDPYELQVVAGEELDDDARAALSRVGYTALLDTNVEVRMAEDITSLGTDLAAELEGLSLPAAVLQSPAGIRQAIELSADAETLRAELDALVQSPKRTEIQNTVMDRYGIVLVVEGGDRSEFERAVSEAESAITRIHTKMKMLPKAIAQPPALITLERDEFDAESLLLWSLELPEAGPEESIAVVLYGRARRLGPNLTGDDLNAKQIGDFLGVIGADCECGLDRSWMQGTMLPTRWNTDRQALMAQRLGFDPDDPMVKTEISMLISKSARVGGGSDSKGTISPDMSFGYQEVTAVVDETFEGEEMVEGEDGGSSLIVAATAPPELPAEASPEPAAAPESAPSQPVAERAGVALMPVALVLIVVVCLITAFILGRAYIVRTAG